MREETTNIREAQLRVTGYADGFYNLEIHRNGVDVNIELGPEQAQMVCDVLDVEFPDPEPEPPEQWG